MRRGIELAAEFSISENFEPVDMAEDSSFEVDFGVLFFASSTHPRGSILGAEKLKARSE
jgi:hypothetical protein